MANGTWKQLTAGLGDEDLEKITAYREFCRGLPGVEERIHSADIAFAVKRTFSSAYVKSHYLEVGIELLREVGDPKPRTSFHTTKRVVMHRYSLLMIEQFDDAIRELIREAAATVGPGTR